MKDVSATLRRIDEEITATRQQIAALQVNIVRLEDARRVFMGMAEADQAARESRGAVLLPGSAAHPVLVVRKTGSGINGKRFKAKRRVAGTRKAAYTDKIMAELASGATMTSTELADAFGLKQDNKTRHPLREVLRELVLDGQLVRQGNARNYAYSLA